MATRRCSNCGINWPSDSDFGTCYECGGSTSWIANDEPDFNKKEGMRRKAHWDFERHYEKRGERPLPEKMALEVQEAVHRATEAAKPLIADWHRIRALPTTTRE